MKRPFAAFDIDGTIIRWQLYHAMGDAMAKDGVIPQEEFAKVRQARMLWKKRGGHEAFYEYEKVLVTIFDRALKGLEVTKFDDIAAQVFEEYSDQAYTYTRKLIVDLRERNYLLFAISGSPETIVKQVAVHYGFDDYCGTKYVTKNGRFTGEKELTLGRKAEYLKALLQRYNITQTGSIAVGDSEGDVPMLEMVERPIAFNPSRQLFAHAMNAGWQVVLERKNMVYELEPTHGSYVLAQTNSR